MSAAIEAWTTLDPTHGFSFEITSMEGSGLIQRRVLIAALEAEQAAVQSGSNKAQSALTPAQLRIPRTSPEPGRLVRMDVKPRRKHVMLNRWRAVHRGGLGPTSFASRANCRSGPRSGRAGSV